MRVAITDLLAGTPYYLQFRANYGDHVTEWSRRFSITTINDTVAPATPANPTWETKGLSFVATWDAVTLNENGTECKDFSNYLVKIEDGVNERYFKTADEGFELTYELNRAAFGLSASLTFSVASVDQTGNVSAYSTPIVATNAAPAEPANFDAQQAPEAMVLKWDAVDEDDIKEYRVHMSTDSASFTPDETNLIWRGLATGMVIQSTNYVTHYFKLAAIDAFNTPSTYASDSASPGSSAGADTEAPGVPANLTVSASMNSRGRADFTVEWDAVSDGDLAGYSVRYRPTGSSGAYTSLSVDHDTTSALVRDLEVGQSYDFQVSAYDFSANYSAWSSVVAEELANAAPSKPSAPSILSETQGFAITHDLTKDAGGALEADVIRLEVWIGDTEPESQVASIAVEPGSPVVVSELITVPSTETSLNVYVRAVDYDGLTSDYSDPTTWTVGMLTGEYFEDASIGSAKIQNLEANKIVAGTGIVNNLDVKSKLTIGDGGSIVSEAFETSGGTDGFQLTDDNLIIKSGSIDARALNIQLGRNLIPLKYASFENFESTYTTGDVADAPGDRVISTLNDPEFTITTEEKRFENQSLKLMFDASGQAVFLASDPYGLDYARPDVPTMLLDLGQTYIVSYYVYNAGAGAEDFSAIVRENSVNSTYTNSIPAGSWTRQSFEYTPTTGDFSLGFSGASGTTFYVDGVQVEEKTSDVSEPSAWYPPSSTTIDGGTIRTGQIRSSETVTVNGVEQPSWLINLQGGAQFGDVKIRGTLIVGSATGDEDDGESRMQSSNYMENQSGWIIKSDGYAEFRDLAVNSISMRALDRPTQSSLYSNLFDFAEAPGAWKKLDGTPATILENYAGAMTSNTVIQLDELGQVTRPGVEGRGVSLDPSALYRVSITMRCVSESSQINFYLQAYDIAGDPLSLVEVTPQFIMEAEAGTNYDAEPYGWQVVTSYVQGQSDTPVPVEDASQFNPIPLPVGTAYVVPTVIHDWFNSTPAISQVDSLIIEAIGVKAPSVVQTGSTTQPRLLITGDDFEPRIQMFSSRESEKQAGEVKLDSNSAQQELVMRPPTDDVPVDSPVRRAEIRVSSRTANLIPFTQQGHIPWHPPNTEPNTTVDLAEDGRSGTVTIGDSAIGRVFHWAGSATWLNEIAPELIGEEYIVASAKIRASVSADFVVEIGHGTNAGATVRYSTPMSTVADEWVDIHTVRYIEGGMTEDFRPYVHLQFTSSQPAGTTYEFKDVMVERGQTPSTYKPYSNSVIQVNGDMMNTPTRLFVGLPRHNYYDVFGGYTSVQSRREDHNSRYNPAIIMESDSGIVGGMQLIEDGNGDRLTLGGKNMPHIELHDRTTEHHDSGKLLIWSSITDSGGRNLIALSENKWYDEELSPNMPYSERNVTSDFKFHGHLKVGGTPPWRNLPLAPGWTTDSVGLRYYINNGWLFVRGRVQWSNGNNWNPGVGGQALTSLPAHLVELLPYSPLDVGITGTASTGGDMSLAVFRLDASDGEISIRPLLGPNETAYPDTDWQTLTPINGYSLYNPTRPIQVKRTGNQVFLRGQIATSGVNYTGSPKYPNCANMPAEFRPSQTELLPLTVSHVGDGWLSVFSNGNIRPEGFSEGSVQWISLSSTWAVDDTSTSIYNPLKQWVFVNAKFPLTYETAYIDPSPDYTAPGQVTDVSVEADASSETVGSQRVYWTNPSTVDLAGVKIIYRANSAPTVTINDAVDEVKTMSTPDKVQTIFVSSQDLNTTMSTIIPSLAVGRTWHYKIVTFDKHGNHSQPVSASRFLLRSPVTLHVDSYDTYALETEVWRENRLYQGRPTAGAARGVGTMFYGNKIYNELNRGGVRRVPWAMMLALGRQNSNHGKNPSRVMIRPHGYATRPAGEPNTGPVIAEYLIKRGVSDNYQINNGMEGFANGTYKGLALHNPDGSEAAIMDINQDWQADLHIYTNG